MSDLLLEIGQNPRARGLIKTLGLPLPIPQKLRRATGPWEERPLHGLDVALGMSKPSALLPHVAITLCQSGANPWVAKDDALPAFVAPGEAHGRPARKLHLDSIGDAARYDALVYDATGLDDPAALRALHDFFHPLLGHLAHCGRAIVLSRPVDSATSAGAAAARAALDGFVRSLGKELGKRGSTAQLLIVEDGAEARLEGVLRFLLSPRSAFISGQPFHVTARVKAPTKPEYVHSLEGKIALVTGAARGIGEATARLLADEGAHVVCVDRPDDASLVSKVARDLNGSVLLADVTDPEAPARLAAELRAKHGGVDVVVHNAGITRDKTLGNMKAELWDQTVDVNLGSVVRITAALEGVLRDHGRLICLSSVAGLAGNVGQTNYAASKAGIVGFIRHQAAVLANRGITVNAIAPGFIETRLTAAIPVVIREVGRRLSSLGQGGLPRDVAETITFLATPASYGLTGSVVRVCGGAFIGA